MPTLEALAVAAWKLWGAYAKWTLCSGCGAATYCRAKRPSGPFVCVDCHDQL